MSKGLTNQYVEQLCKQLLKKHFIGVYPCDIQPKITKKNFSIVFNTGDSTTKGEHFIALYVKNKIIYYFDSFGRIPRDNNILSFIKHHRNKRRLKVWKKKIQDDVSNFCGFYCAAFLIHKHRNMNSFGKMFTSNLRKNDEKVVEFIVKSYKKM